MSPDAENIQHHIRFLEEERNVECYVYSVCMCVCVFLVLCERSVLFFIRAVS